MSPDGAVHLIHDHSPRLAWELDRKDSPTFYGVIGTETDESFLPPRTNATVT